MDIALKLLPSFVQIDTTRLLLGGLAVALLLGLATWFFYKPAQKKVSVHPVPAEESMPAAVAAPTYVPESVPASESDESAGEHQLPEPNPGLMPDLGQGMSA